jgi:hypothetical protein
MYNEKYVFKYTSVKEDPLAKEDPIGTIIDYECEDRKNLSTLVPLSSS